MSCRFCCPSPASPVSCDGGRRKRVQCARVHHDIVNRVRAPPDLCANLLDAVGPVAALDENTDALPSQPGLFQRGRPRAAGTSDVTDPAESVSTELIFLADCCHTSTGLQTDGHLCCCLFAAHSVPGQVLPQAGALRGVFFTVWIVGMATEQIRLKHHAINSMIALYSVWTMLLVAATRRSGTAPSRPPRGPARNSQKQNER